ncbi:MAG: hypothetical protein KGI52_12690, partial [Burkholderiales bacterium]|nr:hypothetical protein [Burkholderiales bacterium]
GCQKIKSYPSDKISDICFRSAKIKQLIAQSNWNQTVAVGALAIGLLVFMTIDLFGVIEHHAAWKDFYRDFHL